MFPKTQTDKMKSAFSEAQSRVRKSFETVVGSTTQKSVVSQLPQFKNVYDMPPLGIGAADGTFRPQ